MWSRFGAKRCPRSKLKRCSKLRRCSKLQIANLTPKCFTFTFTTDYTIFTISYLPNFNILPSP